MTSHRWKRFFNEAGLPSDISDNYAIIFTENRIRFDMLDELNKEILYDMGIKKMGDVISILRHAKEVHSNSYREKVFNSDVGDEKINSSNKIIHQADSSTLTSTNNNRQSQNQRTSRVVKLPQENQPSRIVQLPSNSPTTINNTNNSAQSRISQEQPQIKTQTTIIRNVTGLNAAVAPLRKRIEPPGDDDNTKPNQITTIRKIAKVDHFNHSSSSTATTANRNKLEAQNRLTNFSNQIQKAISSNDNTNNVNIIRKQIVSSNLSLITPTRQQQQEQQRLPITARLTMNKSNATLITRSVPPMMDISPSLSTKTISIKDRLGRKSVFERIDSTSKSSPLSSQRTILRRLGTK